MSGPLSSRDVRAHAVSEIDRLRDRLASGQVADDDGDVRALQARVILNGMFQFTGLALPDGTLIEANQTALDAGGIERGHVIGRPVWETHWFSVTAETQRRLRDAVARAGETGELVRYDVDVYASAHGTDTVPIDFSARPVAGSDGEVAFLVLEGRDIGEKKRAQELKDQLFANVSHELRTPLTLILGRAAAIVDDTRVPTDVAEAAERMQDNAQLLLSKVNDLLQVAALEGQGVQVAPRPVDLGDLVRWVVANFASLAAERAVEIRVEGEASLPVLIDPEHVATILVNLVANALRFAADEGLVVVSAARIDDEVRLEVRDDGPGVPEDSRELVFDPFRQVDRGPSRQHGGTGLGLAIVRQLSELLGGRAEVDDAPEGGARFRVTLPHRPADERQTGELNLEGGPLDAHVEGMAAAHRLERWDPAADAPVPAEDGVARLLLVEDNPDLRRFLREELGATYRLDAAANGLQALEVLSERGEEVDLIVTDVMMPHLGGDELIRRLRGDTSLPQPPVLVLTAREDQQLRERLLTSGADDYVVKPFSLAELRARIENLLAPIRLQRQLEQANAALERYASQVSHDLKTPLTTIIGFAETLVSNATALSAEDRQQMLERIAANGRRLEELVDEMLADVRGDLPRDRVALDEVLAEVEDLLADPIADAEGVIDRPEPLPRVAANRGAVRNVLLNLLDNSLTYRTPERPPHIVVTARVEEGVCEVTVADNGPGIPVEDRQRVLRPGDRGSDETKLAQHGTGLGLSGARQTLARHGGEIWVADHHEGQGATLRFTLPLAQEPPPAP